MSRERATARQHRTRNRFGQGTFTKTRACFLAAALWFSAMFTATGVCNAQVSASVADRFREATAAMRAGRLQEAEAGFSAIVKADPSFAEAYLNLGLVLEDQGKNAQAAENFHKAIGLKPRLRGANLFLGIAEYRLNHVPEAVGALEKETQSYANDANAWMWLGIAQLANDQPEKAAKDLDKAAELDPKNVDILYHRGRAHLLVSKGSYEQMFKLDPDSWRVHQVLAQAYAESERHEQAVAEFEVAIKKASNQPGLHEELGTEYLRMGKTEAAEAEFRLELHVDPDSATALYRLGTVQVESGDPVGGKNSIETALKKSPRLKNAQYYLGRAQMQLRNDEAAIAAFKQAITAESDADIIQQAWYQLGVVYRRSGRMEEAKQALAMFQKLKDASNEHEQQMFQRKRAAQLEGQPADKANPPE